MFGITEKKTYELNGIEYDSLFDAYEAIIEAMSDFEKDILIEALNESLSTKKSKNTESATTKYLSPIDKKEINLTEMESVCTKTFKTICDLENTEIIRSCWDDLADTASTYCINNISADACDTRECPFASACPRC